MCYNVTFIFDYNYASASLLGLCSYGLLPEQTSGVPMSWALVFIPLSPTKLDALQRFGGEERDLGVDRRNFTSPHILLGNLVLCVPGEPYLGVYGLLELVRSLQFSCGNCLNYLSKGFGGTFKSPS
jgi:hypothetical protein